MNHHRVLARLYTADAVLYMYSICMYVPLRWQKGHLAMHEDFGQQADREGRPAVQDERIGAPVCSTARLQCSVVVLAHLTGTYCAP